MEMISPDQVGPQVTTPEINLDQAVARKVFLIKLSIYIILVLIVIASFAGFVYFRYQSLQKVREMASKRTEDLFVKKTPIEYPPATSNLSVAPSIKANTAVEWYANPVKLNNLSLILGFESYSCDDELKDSDRDLYINHEVSYYEVGKNSNNKIILATFIDSENGQRVDEKTNLFFEQTPDNKYIFMQDMFVFISNYFTAGVYVNNKFYESPKQYGERHNPESCAGYVLAAANRDSIYQQEVTVNTSTYYFGFDWPLTITYNNLRLRLHDNPYRGVPSALFDGDFGQGRGADKLIKIASSADGDLYSLSGSVFDRTGNIFPDLKTKMFLLKLPSGLYSYYYVDWDFFDVFTEGIYNDPYSAPDNKPEITWNNGNKNNDRYNDGLFPGVCERIYEDGDYKKIAEYVVSANDPATDLKEVGVTSNGQPVYEFKDSKHPILRFIYDFSYISLRDFDSSDNKTAAYNGYDKSAHQVIVYKHLVDGTRPEYFIFFNIDQNWQEECPKEPSGLQLW